MSGRGVLQNNERVSATGAPQCLRLGTKWRGGCQAGICRNYHRRILTAF